MPNQPPQINEAELPPDNISPPETNSEKVNPAEEFNSYSPEQDEVNGEIFAVYERETESASLAEYVRLQKDSPEDMARVLRGYFEQKKELFSNQEAGALAQEIIFLESSLLAKIEEQIETQFPNIEKDNKDRTIDSIREVLYSSVLSGYLSGEKLSLFLDGGITIQTKPGPEVKEGDLNYDQNKIFGLFTNVDGKTTIFLYENFITAKDNSQRHILRHEIGHVLGEKCDIFPSDIWFAFLKASQNPTPDVISKFKEYPELVDILKTLANPKTEKLIWNNYIRERLDTLEEIGDANKPAEREQVAKELVAEMIAFHLEYGATKESYLSRRLQFSSRDGVEAYILKKTGTSSLKDLGIAKNMNFKQTAEILAQRPELSSLFSANEAWHERLSQKFEGRAAQLNIRELPEGYELYDEDEFGEDDFELEDLEDTLVETPVAETAPTEQKGFGFGGSKAPAPPKSVFALFWEMITETPTKN